MTPVPTEVIAAPTARVVVEVRLPEQQPDRTDSNDAGLVILGAIIALAGTVLVQVIKGWQDGRLDSTRRKDDRRLARDNFERASVLELQADIDSMHTMAGLALRNKLGLAPMPPDFDTQLAHLMARVRKHEPLVADAALRRFTDEYVDALDALVQASGGVAAAEALKAVSEVYDKIMDRAGQVVRATHSEPDDPQRSL